MISKFVELKKAAQITGKSISTLTRFLNKYKDTNEIKTQGKKYYISLKLLSKHFEVINQNEPMINHGEPVINQNEPQKTNEKTDVLNAKNEIIEILKQQNNFLQNEIESKNKQISELTETGKAQIYLIRDLQNTIAIAQSKTDVATYEPPAKEKTNVEYTSFESEKSYIDTKRKMIVELHSKGFAPAQIANEMIKQGILNHKGNPYNKNTIQKILKRIEKRK